MRLGQLSDSLCRIVGELFSVFGPYIICQPCKDVVVTIIEYKHVDYCHESVDVSLYACAITYLFLMCVCMLCSFTRTSEIHSIPNRRGPASTSPFRRGDQAQPFSWWRIPSKPSPFCSLLSWNRWTSPLGNLYYSAGAARLRRDCPSRVP